MMKRILLPLLLILCFSFSFAQKDSLAPDTPRKKKIEFTAWDYPHYYPSVRDTDSINYVQINRELIKTPETRDTIKYPLTDFNYKNQASSLLKNINNILVRKPNSNWLPLLILLTLIYYVIVRRIFSKSFPVIFQSYWNDRAIQQLAKDDNFFKLRTGISLFVLYCLIFALFLYNLSDYFNLLKTRSGLKEYFFILNTILVFYVLKYLVNKIISYVFSFQRLMTAHLAILSVSNLVYILIAAPFLLFYQYLPKGALPYILIILALLFVFNTFYKYIRSSVFAISNFQFSKFYLFIYLCTLEIVPLLLIIKIVLIDKF